jgi:hypothetical protein
MVLEKENIKVTEKPQKMHDHNKRGSQNVPGIVV